MQERPMCWPFVAAQMEYSYLSSLITAWQALRSKNMSLPLEKGLMDADV
jgi:hypothetical protein